MTCATRSCNESFETNHGFVELEGLESWVKVDRVRSILAPRLGEMGDGDGVARAGEAIADCTLMDDRVESMDTSIFVVGPFVVLPPLPPATFPAPPAPLLALVVKPWTKARSSGVKSRKI